MPPLFRLKGILYGNKINHLNCRGMDIQKNVIATIVITDRKTNITEYFQRSFSTLNSDLYRLKDSVKSHHCFDVWIESANKNWIPIFNIFKMKSMFV